MSVDAAPSSRLRRLWLPASVLLVAALLGAWIGLRALAAKSHLEEARTQLSTARVALLDRRVDDARAAMASATRDTAAARSLTGDPVWRLSAAVPVLGRSLAAVRGITTAVDDLARQVLPPGLQAADTFAGEELRLPDGSIDLALVTAAEPAVAQADAALGRVDDRLGLLPTSGIVGPVRDAHTQLEGEIAQLASALASARQVVALAPPLLGADRPRRYFVLVQQPGESRGTGGLPGGYAILEADRGRVRVTQTGSNADLKNGDIPVPAGVSEQFAYEYTGNLGFQLWQNVNLSPDLPSVARVVAARWKAQGGQDVDGVITMDPTAIADLLRGGGPVDVGGGTLVAPANMVRYLTVDQYAGLSLRDQAGRKDALSGVAQKAAERLNSGAADPGQLLSGLANSVRTGHLRMASDDPALRDGLAASGVDGALPAGDAPVAYAVVQNSTQGKLDSFLDRHITYAAGACRGVRRASTITVQLTNQAPPTGLPPYLTIRDDGGGLVSSVDSAVVLQTYGSRTATFVSAELNGRPLGEPGFSEEAEEAELHEGLEADLPFWGLRVNLPRGVPQVLTLHLEEDVVPGVARVPEQPLVRGLTRTVTAPTC
jgi:hypothetical protein